MQSLQALCQFFFLESPSLHVSIDGDFSGELYIGVRIDFVLTAAYPKGTYNQILLKTYALTTCIDVGDPDCSHGKGVRSDSVRLVTAPSEVEVCLVFFMKMYSNYILVDNFSIAME